MERMTKEECMQCLRGPVRTGRLATVRKDGRPLVVPVWYDLEGETVVFMTAQDSPKAKNMRRDPRVSVCVDDSALRHYELLGTHLQSTKGYTECGEMQTALRQDASPFRQGFYRSHPWGTPEQTIARATELTHAFGTDEIMFIFKYGSMPMATAEKSLMPSIP